MAASLRIDDFLPWVIVEPESPPLPGDTLVVTFEDACRVRLGVAPADLTREFPLTDAVPVPESLEGVTFEQAVIGDGCETLRALQVDVTLPRAFVPWRAALAVELAAIPTGEASSNPT